MLPEFEHEASNSDQSLGLFTADQTKARPRVQVDVTEGVKGRAYLVKEITQNVGPQLLLLSHRYALCTVQHQLSQPLLDPKKSQI